MEDDTACCTHEAQVDELKASLKKSQDKNTKLQGNLAALEVMCMEMGDKSEEYIEEVQAKNEELTKDLAEQKDKVVEMEGILTAAGEERAVLLERREADKLSLERAETNNNFIISEAEARATQADSKQSELLAQIAELEEQLSTLQHLPTDQTSSPGSKRRRSSINRDSLTNTDTLLKQINELERAAITKQSENDTIQKLYSQALDDLEAKKEETPSVMNTGEEQALVEQFNNQSNRIQSLSDELAQTKSDLSQKTSELRLAGQDTLNLHTELETLNQQLVDKTAYFESVCSELKAELTYLADTILEEKGKYDTLKAEKDELEVMRLQHDEQLNLLMNRVSESERVMGERTEELDVAKQELMELKLSGVETSQDANLLSESLLRAEGQILALKSQIETIKQSFEAASAESLTTLTSITTQCDALTSEKGVLQEELLTLQQTLTDLSDKLRDKMSELDEAKSELMNIKLSNIDEATAASSQTIVQLNDKVHVLSKELAEGKAEYEGVRRELENVRSEDEVKMMTIRDELEGVRASYDAAMKRAKLIPELEEQLRLEKSRVPSNIEEIEEMKSMLSVCEAQLVTKLEELDECRAELMQLKLSGVDHESESSQMSEAITRLQSEIQALQSARKSDLDVFEEKERAAKATVCDLEATIEKLRADKETVQASPAKNQDSEENQREEVKYLKLALTEMSDHLEQLKVTIELMESSAHSFQSALSEKDSMLNNKMTEISSLSSDKVEAERKLEELQQEKSLLESQLHESLNQFQASPDYDKDLSLLKSQISEKEEIIWKLNAHNSALTDELQSSKEDSEVKEDKICSMNIEMGSLRMQSNIIGTLEEKVRSLNQQLETDQCEFNETQNALKVKITGLEAQVTSLTEELEDTILKMNTSLPHDASSSRSDSDVGQLTRELDSAKLKLGQKSDQCVQLQRDLDANQSVCVKYEGLRQLREKEEFDFLEEKMELETRLEKIMEDHSASLTLMKEKEDTLVKHTQSLLEKSQLIEHLQAEVSHEKSVAEQLRGDIDNLMSSLTKNQSTLKQQEEHLAGDFQSVISAKDTEMSTLRSDLEACADIIQDLQDKKEKGEEAQIGLTARIAELQQEMVILKEQAESRVVVLNEQVASKERMFAMQANTHSDLQSKYADTDHKLIILMESHIELESKHAEIELRLTRSIEEKVELERRLASNQGVSREVSDLKTQLQDYKSKIGAGTLELTRLQGLLSATSQALTEKDGVISTMRVDLESCADIIEDLQEKYRKSSDDHTAVSQQLQQVESERMKLHSKYIETENRVDKLREEKEEMNVRLTNQLRAMRCTLDDYNNKIEKGSELLSKWQSDYMAKEGQLEACKKEVDCEKEKVKESERSLDDLKEKHLALMNEADQLENQLGESERNLENNHEQWEKEIIRRKYVERQSGLEREGRSGSVEEFVEKSERDHTEYLNSLEYTYRNMKPRCEKCDGRGSENTDPNAAKVTDISYVVPAKRTTPPLSSHQPAAAAAPRSFQDTSQNKSYNDRSSSSQNRSHTKPKVSLNESNTTKTRTVPKPTGKDECKQQ